MVPESVLYAANGVRRTRALFSEYNFKDPYFTLSSSEQEGLVNIRKLFIEHVTPDPTEVQFAETVFNDYEHWQKIANATFMKPYLAEWRKVTDARRKSEAFKTIIEEAKSGNSRLSAAKYIIEEPWKGRTPAAKKKIKETTMLAAKENEDDFNRLKEFIQ